MVVGVPPSSGEHSYCYVIFLTILLVDRAFRDDLRCGEKYGKYWQQYQSIVPYRLIPGVL